MHGIDQTQTFFNAAGIDGRLDLVRNIDIRPAGSTY